MTVRTARTGTPPSVIPANAGMMPSTPMRLSLLTVIPAKTGIHRASTEPACGNRERRGRDQDRRQDRREKEPAAPGHPRHGIRAPPRPGLPPVTTDAAPSSHMAHRHLPKSRDAGKIPQ